MKNTNIYARHRFPSEINIPMLLYPSVSHIWKRRIINLQYLISQSQNLITLSSIYITGNLNTENVILADSLCDYTLNVGGNIKTKTILEYGHCIISYKKITAKEIFSCNGIEDENGDLDENITSENLIDEIVETEDGEKVENLSKTIQYIKNGGTVFTS